MPRALPDQDWPVKQVNSTVNSSPLAWPTGGLVAAFPQKLLLGGRHMYVQLKYFLFSWLWKEYSFGRKNTRILKEYLVWALTSSSCENLAKFFNSLCLKFAQLSKEGSNIWSVYFTQLKWESNETNGKRALERVMFYISIRYGFHFFGTRVVFCEKHSPNSRQKK